GSPPPARPLPLRPSRPAVARPPHSARETASPASAACSTPDAHASLAQSCDRSPAHWPPPLESRPTGPGPASAATARSPSISASSAAEPADTPAPPSQNPAGSKRRAQIPLYPHPQTVLLLTPARSRSS